MTRCRWIHKVERNFDGDTGRLDEVRAHVADCPECAAHLRDLERLRQGAKASRSNEGISESQFPAFMQGIREQCTSPVKARSWRWAIVSMAAASLIVAISIYAVVTGGPAKVEAETVVESVSTDLNDATVTYQNSKDGTAVVWVHVAEEDIW